LDNIDTEEHFDHLFINRKSGKPYTTIPKAWERIRDLRHSYASFLVNSGISLFQVQQILGHSQPQVTQRYSHLSTRTLQEEANTAAVIINRASRGDTATD
jgi:integrase